MFRDCINRLKKLGLRFFTTTSLLTEIKIHLWFADNKVVKQYRQDSAYIIASAKGESPYRKPNLFMEGFINWQAAGNPCNWQSYLYNIFQEYDYTKINFEKTLGNLGIEVIDLEAWPGFSVNDHAIIEDYASQITQRLDTYLDLESEDETVQDFATYKKAKPEAEAINIIKKERDGNYNIISEKGKKKSAWFISHTSMLNLLEKNTTITWQPEAFMSFASTICGLSNADSAKQAFERIVLGLAQSGMQLLDDETIGRVFGGVIEQARLDMEQLRAEYEGILQSKYGESIESVLARVSPGYFPIAVSQIIAEIAHREAELRRTVEATSLVKDKEIEKLKKELAPLEKYKAKLAKKQSKKKKKSKNRKKR